MRTIYSAVLHNLFIKIIALFLAILTWSYIVGQLYKQVPEAQRTHQTVVALAGKNVIVKRVPVHINLIGAPEGRYQVAIDRIRVNPSECVISGPIDKIETVSFVTTEPISAEGLTKSIRQRVKLKEIPGCSISKEQQFTVAIPIVRKRLR